MNNYLDLSIKEINKLLKEKKILPIDLVNEAFERIENDKLNMVFGKQPGVLKKKYGIDIKEQMLKYDFSKFSFGEDTKKGGKKNAVR